MLRKQPWLTEASGAWTSPGALRKRPAIYLSVMGVKTEVKYPADEKNIWIDNAGVNQIVSIPDDESIL